MRTLTNGTTWAYLYDRRTGKQVGKEQVLPDDNARPGSVAALIRDYKASQRFRSRKPRTRALYEGALKRLQDAIGSTSFASIGPAMIEGMRDEMAATPSAANLAVVMMSVLGKLAVRQGLVSTNPAAGVERLYVRSRIEIWSREEEQRRLARFRPRLKLLAMLMLYTMQRLSDVLAMTISQVQEFEGRLYIVVRQSKTGALVGIPVHEALDPLVRARLAETVTITVIDADGIKRVVTSTLMVPSPHGLQWTRRNASRAWDHDQALADADLAEELTAAGWTAQRIAADLRERHRQRRDLRRTGVIRLVEAGCTPPQIAALTGHSIDWCMRILDVYIPRRTETALGGILAWEIGERAGPRVVRLSDVAALESDAQRRRERVR